MPMTVTEIRQGLASGQFSSVEITRDYLQRIAQHRDVFRFLGKIHESILL